MALYWGDKKVALYLGDTKVKFTASGPYGLPEGYTPLDYVESTGTQYIELPHYFTNTDEMYARAAVTAPVTSSDKYFISPKAWNNSNNRFALGGFYARKFTCAYGGLGTPSSAYVPNTAPDQKFHEYHYKDRTFKMLDLGLVFNASNITWGKETAALRLFYGYNAATACKLGVVWHKRDGEYLYYLLPAQRDSDGAVGMYDGVSGQFFTNNGTGDFIPGYKLPEGYTSLTFLQSSGTQRIDTNVNGNARWVLTAQSTKTTAGTQVAIAGTNNASAATWYGVAGTNWACGSLAASTIPMTTKATADLTFDSNGVRGTVNDQAIERDLATFNQQWSLFHTKGSDSFQGKIFKAKAYQNNKVVANLVPVVRTADSVLGLFDLVSQQFFTNVGTGNFTAGTASVNPASTLAMYRLNKMAAAELAKEPIELAQE